MRRVTAIAVALAAGMTSFAACAHEAPMDGGKIMAEALAAAKQKPSTEKPSTEKPRAEVRKAEVHKKARKKIASRITRHERRVADRSKSLPGVEVDRTKAASIDKEPAVAHSAPAGDPSQAYNDIIDRYAKEYGVASSLARAVIQVESGYDPNETGLAGEVGLMQIKPATARMLGYSGTVKQLYDPETNIKWGMKYLAMAQEAGNGTTCGTILKYNAGHDATHMNPISAAYCGRVKAELADAAT
jgi:soluble lytic murein transglycosylase-like protein